ncbi:MAG: acylhydrolase [Bacteroidaceae bacterium]|nr:acylhydrolase [Bacteroidaceae bacterium]
MAENGTYNSFEPESWTDNRIDHIFVSKQFSVQRYGILTPFYWTKKGRKDEYIVRHLSDHYPISTTLELPRLRSPQDWAQYGNYDKSNKDVKNAKVVFMGNSITSNWYRFHKEFFEQHEGYVCRGISGQVTAQMLARFRSDVINLRPDTVVILAGTNDLAMNQGYVSIEHIFENIVSMTELAQHNGISVVLCSVLPADRYTWSWEVSSERVISSIKELNAKIKDYAQKQGIPYADYYSEMVDDKFALKKQYQQDPVHPNVEGYYVMEKVIRQVLKSTK